MKDTEGLEANIKTPRNLAFGKVSRVQFLLDRDDINTAAKNCTLAIGCSQENDLFLDVPADSLSKKCRFAVRFPKGMVFPMNSGSQLYIPRG
jgi:hypothetical protein